MNATQEIKINGMRKEVDAWRRYIHLTRDGVDYDLTLFWDQFDGYEILWRSVNGELNSVEPDWSVNWNEDEHNGQYLSWWLDELTCDMEGK